MYSTLQCNYLDLFHLLERVRLWVPRVYCRRSLHRKEFKINLKIRKIKEYNSMTDKRK